ncbi:uncharacterized protein BKA55DRAFT_397132 [Fusarium redolens]|uniref:Uncharacterized protein n=1 Tax=Fusarium redolens TaxID=48865 RepID=A0A9P9K9J0_FUSRE|nr:uncharacterized protein BKA55DRAFT_397132 [Fusarium redolens]KAH7249131.1 hypothetical protein BKA55DRAFT_397132 [Fusarium redolens]
MIPAEWGRRTGDFRRLPRAFTKWLHQVRHLVSFIISPVLSHLFISHVSFPALSFSSISSFRPSLLVLLKCLSTKDFKMPLTLLFFAVLPRSIWLSEILIGLTELKDATYTISTTPHGHGSATGMISVRFPMIGVDTFFATPDFYQAQLVWQLVATLTSCHHQLDDDHYTQWQGGRIVANILHSLNHLRTGCVDMASFQFRDQSLKGN